MIYVQHENIHIHIMCIHNSIHVVGKLGSKLQCTCNVLSNIDHKSEYSLRRQRLHIVLQIRKFPLLNDSLFQHKQKYAWNTCMYGIEAQSASMSHTFLFIKAEHIGLCRVHTVSRPSIFGIYIATYTHLVDGQIATVSHLQWQLSILEVGKQLHVPGMLLVSLKYNIC